MTEQTHLEQSRLEQARLEQFDLIVIGAGPGGYVAAIRASQLGLKVACVECESSLGGTCLRIGCIPSKALLESSEKYAEVRGVIARHGVKVAGVQLDLTTMMKRKNDVVTMLTRGVEALFKKNVVTRYQGHARITGVGRVSVDAAQPVVDRKPVELAASHIIVATGSKPSSLPGVTVDGDRIGTSTEALSFSEVPHRFVVIGAGAIGLELGSVWRRLGAEVTVLEYLDRILPGMDSELASEGKKILARQGIKFMLGSRVVSATSRGDEVTIDVDGRDAIVGDRVLVATGRIPNTEGLGLETVGIACDTMGRIPVDDQYRTTAPGVYAIGDVIDGPMLAHKAEEEGIACAEIIAAGHDSGGGRVNYRAIPSVVYTKPEIASVGWTEDELKLDGRAYRRGVFPFRANGRARCLDDTDGFVKILADQSSDRLLGAHIIGPHAGDLIAECALAITLGATSESLARSCHAHPTLAEAVKEAALAAEGRAIHS